MIFRRFAWRHPEWWTVALAAAAWTFLAWRAAMEDHARTHGANATFAFGDWFAMVAAMMFPLVLPSVRQAASQSLWPRRHRAITALLCGYCATWLLFGVMTQRLLSAVDVAQRPWALSAGLALAATWQLVPMRWRAARACHRTLPLAPHGLAADRDCLRYGWMVGVPCVITCWPLMATCAVSHDLSVMLGVSLIAAMDRYRFRPQRRLTVGVLSAMAIVSFNV